MYAPNKNTTPDPPLSPHSQNLTRVIFIVRERERERERERCMSLQTVNEIHIQVNGNCEYNVTAIVHTHQLTFYDSFSVLSL